LLHYGLLSVIAGKDTTQRGGFIAREYH
jgi:hypothetical protein